jgi:hypothetical protein
MIGESSGERHQYEYSKEEEEMLSLFFSDDLGIRNLMEGCGWGMCVCLSSVFLPLISGLSRIKPLETIQPWNCGRVQSTD